MHPAQAAYNERKKAERHARGLKNSQGLSLADKLSFHSMPEPNGGCQLWLGATYGHGYGSLNWQGRRHAAHRAAWELANGPVPGDRVVCHRCDVPGCINPSHMFLGTQAQNLADMTAKGRRVSIGNRPRPTKENAPCLTR